MPILVTGMPGSGKTTLVSFANQQGDTSFIDADEIDNLCEWRDNETGEILGLTSQIKPSGIDDWYTKFGWYWNTDVLQNFLMTNPDVVVCGSSENVMDSYALFDKILILKKTAEELVHNLISEKRTNPFGKTPEQRKDFLDWQQTLITEAEKYPYTLIEGNTVEEIYSKVRNHTEEK